MKNNRFSGRICIVPLTEKKSAVGLIIRHDENLCLIDFSKTLINASASVSEFTSNDFRNPIYRVIVSNSGLLDNSWQSHPAPFDFVEADWPIPKFRLLERLTDTWLCIQYNERLQEVQRNKASLSEIATLPNAGVAGHKFAVKKLIRLFEGKGLL